MKIPEKLKAAFKQRPRIRVNKRQALRLVAAITGAAVFMLCRPVLLPAAMRIMGQAALFSTAVTMPQGALRSLRDRFAGDTQEDGEEQSQGQSQSKPAAPSSSEPTLEAPVQPPSSSPAPVAPPPDDGKPPEIPKKQQGPLVTLAMLGEEGNPSFLHRDNVWLRNYTKLSADKISKVLEEDCSLELGNADQPQVLIYHTHTTESYEEYHNTVYDMRNSWRDTDNNNNMAAVGEALTQELEKYGISVLHDTEQHDYPSYNGAYERSRKTVEDYLNEYPSIKVTIDLHRDGIIQSDNTVLKPVAEVGGKRAAQLMIVAPCDDGSVGVPEWRENLRFAAEVQASIESSVPNLCRPIFFCYRNYNLWLTQASLLFELGTNGNTLEEALYTARLIAEPIANVLNGHVTG